MLVPAPVQTVYNQYDPAGSVGRPASETGWDADTRIAEDVAVPAAGIGFGLAVSQGTLHGDRSAVLGTLSGKEFLGITMADVTLPNIKTGFTDKYADGDNMAVMVRGDIWVSVQHAVAGEDVFFDATTGAIEISTGTKISTARFMTSTDVNGLAVVRLGMSTGDVS